MLSRKALVRFVPVYGYGWAMRDLGSIDEPPPFTILAEPDSAGLIQGLIVEKDHVLSDLWVVLAPRHKPHTGHYTVEAFREHPDDLTAAVTGFATTLS